MNGLTGIDPVEGGPFLADIPSLVFCLHLLRTETNIDKVREVVEALSLVYLNTIGKRIDPLSCSNIMSGWAEVGMHNEEMFDLLAELVIEKDEDDSFNDSGNGTAIVNIIKSCAKLGFTNSDFLKVILDCQVENFDELDIPWATILFKELGELPVQDATIIV